MKNYLSSNQIEKELDKIKIDSHWDDETIIEFYKKKTREICARLEEEERIKKKELLLNNKNNNFITKNIRLFKMKRPNSAMKFDNNLRRRSLNKPILDINRKESAKLEYLKKVEEPESVLNMLFPYVNENDFRIEPFKSGNDIREEYLIKRQNSKVVKVNLERRIGFSES